MVGNAKEVKSQEMVQGQKVVQWVNGQNDADFRNSVGFFRDPFTGKEFGDAEINAPRVEGHKYAHILASDGKTAIPLSSRFWTRQEKDDYNNSRKNPGTGSVTRGSGSSSAKNEELRKSLLSLKDYLDTVLPGDKNVEKMINELLPPDPAVEKMQKQVANMTEEQKALLKSLLG